MRGVDDVFETRGKGGLTGIVSLSRSHQITQKCKGAPCNPGKAVAYGSQAHGRVGAPVSFQFANEGETRCELTNTAAAVGEDGWAQIAPFGDFPGMVTEVLPGGGVKGKPAPAIQRMDRTAAEAMVAHFNSATSRIMRWLRGVPIFSGHPDFPGTGNRYPDKGHKGVIAQLQVRNDGLYALPVFNGDGQALIQSQPGLGFSARWTAEPVEVVNGVHVLRPTQLISAGLTTQPNLPVQLINDMDLTALIAALKRMGVTIAEGADLAAVTAAITAAADKADGDKAAATTQAANERAALTTAQGEVSRLTGLLTQRTAEHATTLINEAIRSGRATEAERTTLAGQFANDFNGAAAALTARAATQLKTASAAGHVQPGTGAAASTVQERREKAQQFINERMSKGASYDDAFKAVKAERPELFGSK